MSMSWLIVMFILNGTPIIMADFQPQLVRTVDCFDQQRIMGIALAQAFPEIDGMVFCIPDNRRTENLDVPA